VGLPRSLNTSLQCERAGVNKRVRTDQLIRGIIADLPTPSGSVGKILALSLSLSVAASLATMLLWLGLRPQLGEAVGSAPFWIKAGYTFLIGTAGLAALERLGRPGASAGTSFAFAMVTALLLACAAVVELAATPADEHTVLMMGQTSTICPWLIVALSLPLLVGAFLALRQLAPTQYYAAGAAAGLMAGGYSACIYSLHCTEYGLAFLATWYTFGMICVVALGTIFSRLLRW
jgi:hypothetical protein